MDKSQFLEYLKYVIEFLVCSGVVFEITPIKINPISDSLAWIGNKLNRDIKLDLSQVKVEIQSVQTDLQTHVVESWRRDVLDFANSLMLGKKRTKEDFDNIISIHDRYEKYISERKLENGQITLAFGYISTKYQECLDNNGFYNRK